MLLLTWHGTILRVEQAENRLTHAPLVPLRAAARDFSVALPAEALTSLPHALDAETRVIAARYPGTVHLVRGSQYLCAEPSGPFPEFNRAAGAKWESFLPLTEPEAATLRALLAGAWHHEEADDEAPPVPIALDAGFVLTVGPERLDLTVRRPEHAGDASVVIPWPDGPARLRQHGARAGAAEIHLRQTPAAQAPRPVATQAELHANPGTRLQLPASDELYFPPLTASVADRDWALQRAWPGLPPLGRRPTRPLAWVGSDDDSDRVSRWSLPRRPLPVALGARRDRPPRRAAQPRRPQRGAVAGAPQRPHRYGAA